MEKMHIVKASVDVFRPRWLDGSLDIMRA